MTTTQCRTVLDLILEKLNVSRLNWTLVRYLFGALVSIPSSAQGVVISDFYYQLAESVLFGDHALALLIRILEKVICLCTSDTETGEHVDALNRCLSVNKTTIMLPNLLFRELLAQVAWELTADQARKLIQNVAQAEMHIDAGILTSSGVNHHERLLSLFDDLEQRLIIGPTNISKFDLWLEKIGRRDLVQDIISKYTPYQPIPVATTAVNTYG